MALLEGDGVFRKWPRVETLLELGPWHACHLPSSRLYFPETSHEFPVMIDPRPKAKVGPSDQTETFTTEPGAGKTTQHLRVQITLAEDMSSATLGGP